MMKKKKVKVRFQGSWNGGSGGCFSPRELAAVAAPALCSQCHTSSPSATLPPRRASRSLGEPPGVGLIYRCCCSPAHLQKPAEAAPEVADAAAEEVTEAVEDLACALRARDELCCGC